MRLILVLTYIRLALIDSQIDRIVPEFHPEALLKIEKI